MIMDKLVIFGEDLAVFGAAGTVNVGDQIDVGTDGAVGSNDNGKFVIMVDETFVGGTSVEFRIVSDATSTPATDGSATVHASTGAIPIAQLTSGFKREFSPPQGAVYERYLGLQVVRVGTGTAGTINAMFVLDTQNWKTYPEANS